MTQISNIHGRDLYYPCRTRTEPDANLPAFWHSLNLSGNQEERWAQELCANARAECLSETKQEHHRHYQAFYEGDEIGADVEEFMDELKFAFGEKAAELRRCSWVRVVSR